MKVGLKLVLLSQIVIFFLICVYFTFEENVYVSSEEDCVLKGRKLYMFSVKNYRSHLVKTEEAKTNVVKTHILKTTTVTVLDTVTTNALTTDVVTTNAPTTNITITDDSSTLHLTESTKGSHFTNIYNNHPVITCTGNSSKVSLQIQVQMCTNK